LRGTVAEKGESVTQGRGFLAPPQALDALQALGFNLVALSDNHSFDLKVPGIQNTLREVKSRNLAHAGIGNTVEEAVAPGYLHTSKGTVALVAMASGLITEGGSATTTRPGVNELRIEAVARRTNPRACSLPNQGTSRTRRTNNAFFRVSGMPASMPTSLSCMNTITFFLNRPFLDLFNEELPERLAPADWLKKWTHEEIDAGADIIVMHGAPLLHGRGDLS